MLKSVYLNLIRKYSQYQLTKSYNCFKFYLVNWVINLLTSSTVNSNVKLEKRIDITEAIWKV